MASPFNMPDEFAQGFFKSGQSLVRAFVGGRGDSVAGAAQASVLPLAQAHYWQQQMALWMGILASAGGKGQEPVVAADRADRRFHGADWRDNPWYSLLKQTYLLNSRLLGDMVEAAELDEREKHKLRFYARQFIDSMSPANFAATNPDALKLALESKGESVRAGLANLLEDLRRGRISITDETAFEVGRNVATSKGAVVFENELFQLIQYAPLTGEVASRALLIVPPCKRSYWVDGTLDGDAEQWLASAQSVAGSWWTHWMKWLKPHAGKPVAARTKLGNAKYKPIEPAPGHYVKVRID